jgi:hypothetical protein
MLKLIKKLLEIQLRSKTTLELYIASKQPQNSADVERITRDYYNKVNSGYFAG